MHTEIYLNTRTIPYNSAFVDIYVRQLRSLRACRLVWEWCTTAPERDMASSLPASPRNMNFEAPRSSSCFGKPANRRRTAESRIFCWAIHNPTHGSAQLIHAVSYYVGWKGSHFHFPPTVPLPAAASILGRRLILFNIALHLLRLGLSLALMCRRSHRQGRQLQRA